jgi:L-seryl-tRNA(Ser) seleniumtransferase
MDHSRKREWCEEQVKRISEALTGFCGISVERSFPNEAGQPIPRALVRFSSAIDKPAKRVLEELMKGDPGIFAMAASDDAIFINPMTLEEGEVEVVVERLQDIVLKLK